MRILGIESSADETAAAVVEDGRTLLSNAVQSQMDIHALYGGIVPEVSARSHIEAILPVVEQALEGAKSEWDDIDAIAVTYAPGLVGSLLIGTLTARTLALTKNKPLFPIHHVKAHVYANFINPKDRARVGPLRKSASRTVFDAEWKMPEFPLLALIVSGGHTQLVLFQSHEEYEILGKTQDDAVGEAFDKVAKIIGLPYPGGPSIAKAAEKGDPKAYTFPKAKLKGKYDFSFSGLKTAFLRRVQAELGVGVDFPSAKLSERLSESQKHDLAASFQHIAIETLVDKTLLATQEYSPASVVIAGGVAASSELCRQLSKRLPLTVHYPPLSLCTDNAAMIAALAYYESQFKQPINPRELEVIPTLPM